MAALDIGTSLASVAAEAVNKAAETASNTANDAVAVASAQRAEVVAALTANIANCESEISRCISTNNSLQQDIDELRAAETYFNEMSASFSAAVQNSLSRYSSISSVLGLAGSVLSGTFFAKKSEELFRGAACKKAQHAIDNALAKIKEKKNQLQKQIDDNSELIHALAQKQSEYQQKLNASQNG